MKIFAYRKSRRELEHLFFELKQFLSNNYKEPAHKARERLSERTEQLYEDGMLSQKDYEYYHSLAEEYARRMVDYHH